MEKFRLLLTRFLEQKDAESFLKMLNYYEGCSHYTTHPHAVPDIIADVFKKYKEQANADVLGGPKNDVSVSSTT